MRRGVHLARMVHLDCRVRDFARCSPGAVHTALAAWLGADCEGAHDGSRWHSGEVQVPQVWSTGLIGRYRMQWGYNYCIYTPRILLVIVSFTISDIFEQKM